jgi:predicted DNA-binding transcriptional regulator YafY
LTAKELAGELEVSERTIYRDIVALSVAGVPVYSQPGPGGGYGLLDSFRTNLTGLTQGEVKALFMLSIPDAFADLGASQELKAALLKLSAAIPAAFRQDGARVRQRFYLDSTWWQQGRQAIPHLQVLDQAVWSDSKVTITYQLPLGLQIEQLVDPYGLILKAGAWYLVYSVSDSVRVHQVSNLTDVSATEQYFERTVGFNLVSFWKDWCEKREEGFTSFAVEVRAKSAILPMLARYFSDRSRQEFQRTGQPDSEGWATLQLSFESFEAARNCLLGFGSGIEVIEPIGLRLSVIDFAKQTIALYNG